ncbi:hypothetical protein ACG7TL_005130 [Trametes sanguinea]
MAPTLAELALHFQRSKDYDAPSLWAPLPLPLPRTIPFASLLNAYADIIRVCPPSTIGPIQGPTYENAPMGHMPLYIHFPQHIPTRSMPWYLSDNTPDMPLRMYGAVWVPFLGDGVIMDFVDISATGGTLVILINNSFADRVYIRAPEHRLPKVFGNKRRPLARLRRMISSQFH